MFWDYYKKNDVDAIWQMRDLLGQGDFHIATRLLVHFILHGSSGFHLKVVASCFHELLLFNLPRARALI